MANLSKVFGYSYVSAWIGEYINTRILSFPFFSVSLHETSLHACVRASSRFYRILFVCVVNNLWKQYAHRNKCLRECGELNKRKKKENESKDIFVIQGLQVYIFCAKIYITSQLASKSLASKYPDRVRLDNATMHHDLICTDRLWSRTCLSIYNFI